MSPQGDGSATRRTTLPGVGEIAHLHDYETAYLFDEIFVGHAYTRHGVHLEPGDTVLDVGANIGMFSLYVNQRFPGVTVHAFEPAPPVFEVLRENVLVHCRDGYAHDLGISDSRGTQELTFYPASTVFSSFVADPERDAANVRTIVENAVRARVQPGGVDVDVIVDHLVRHRMSSRVFSCRTTTLSHAIRGLGVDSVGLLKIDVEGSEMRILQGLRTADWDRVRQIVMEVHGGAQSVGAVTALLSGKGFEVVHDRQDELLRGTPLSVVHARRPGEVRQA